MFEPAHYSKKTVCPYCNARVRLEDVELTPGFECPICGRYIKVSEGYRRTVYATAWIPGLLVLYALGVRLWWVLLLWWPPVYIPYRVPLRIRGKVSDSSPFGKSLG